MLKCLKVFLIIFFIIFIIVYYIEQNTKVKYRKTGYIIKCIDSNTFLFHSNEDNKDIKIRPSWYETYESKYSNKAYIQATNINISIEDVIKKGQNVLKICQKYVETDVDSDGKKYEYTFICYNKYDKEKRLFCDFEGKDFLYVVFSYDNDSKENYTIEIDNSWTNDYKIIE